MSRFWTAPIVAVLWVNPAGAQTAAPATPRPSNAALATQAAPAATAAASSLGSAGGGGGGGGRNIYDFFCPRQEQCDRVRAAFCRSGLGQLVSNGLRPYSAFTGGIVPPSICPTPDQANADDLKQPPDSAEGAAARIKQDEAGAAERREAVRYLATANCRYYPEAEDALINALRTDRNECVRLEAACALGTGCCCTKKTIAALTIVVEGTEKDGNPAECSDRVKAMAFVALSHCVRCYKGKPEPTTKPPERPSDAPADPGKRPAAPATPKAFYEKLDAAEAERLARAALDRGPQFSPTAAALATGQRDVASLVSAAARAPGAAPAPAPVAEVAPAPTTVPAGGALPPTGNRGLFDILRASARRPALPPEEPAPQP